MPYPINLSETFPPLPRAPIVEAVLHWRARAEKTLEREKLSDLLKAKLPDYPKVQPQQLLQVASQFGPDGAEHTQRAGWHGFRLESEDGRHIAQFTRNGFVFSRLAPYENWHRFVDEAKRLWRIHVELSAPSEIERLGVRFINRIALADVDELESYLSVPPKCPEPLGLPIRDLLYQSCFDVPGHPYNVNVIHTTQPASPTEPDGLMLLLDVDVFTTKTIEPSEEMVDDRLRNMRWLKNQAFFSYLTPSAIERFKEPLS